MKATDTQQHYDLIAEYVRANPHVSLNALASKLGISFSTICRIAKLYGIKRRPRISLDELRKRVAQ